MNIVRMLDRSTFNSQRSTCNGMANKKPNRKQIVYKVKLISHKSIANSINRENAIILYTSILFLSSCAIRIFLWKHLTFFLFCFRFIVQCSYSSAFRFATISSGFFLFHGSISFLQCAMSRTTFNLILSSSHTDKHR